jgi:hypothetical protein
VQAPQTPPIAGGEQSVASTASPAPVIARTFPALHHVDLDGVQHKPDDLILVTEAQFLSLKAAQVFDGEWEDGDELGAVQS